MKSSKIEQVIPSSERERELSNKAGFFERKWYNLCSKYLQVYLDCRKLKKENADLRKLNEQQQRVLEKYLIN